MIKRRKRFEQYTDMFGKLYPELCREESDGTRIMPRTVTFQVTDNCNLACSYCYQINKGTRRMSFETAKKFVDLLLSSEKGFDKYVSPKLSPALIVEFIGGEPFMEIELIDKICDYLFSEMIRLDHPWVDKHVFSICSNGVLYSDPRVQNFLHKHRHNISFSITIDGNKELHDSCRVFHDGSPSYDIAIAGVRDWVKRGNYIGSKITIAPGNIKYVYEAIVHFISELGYDEINCNCVYEDGWAEDHPYELYNQLKQVADYLLENDLEKKVYISIFEEIFFKPKPVDDVQNWCFRAGTLISTPNGLVPIETLNIDDEVCTKTGIHKVEELKSRTIDRGRWMKNIAMPETFTTDDHPYLTKFNGEVSYIPADELTEKHYVAIPVPSEPIVPVNFNRGNKHREDTKEGAIKLVQSILAMGKNPICELVMNFDGTHEYYITYQNEEFSDLYFETLEDGTRIAWARVEYSEVIEESYDVYNLTVEEDHTFIADGTIVHNCGGTGMMLACDPDGKLFPCIRYMESSLGGDRLPYSIGDVDNGIGQCPEHCDRINCLNCIDRRTQSTDECFYCPIADGCSWCSAWNYQVYGTPDARATYICDMHKARALANAYLWAKTYEKEGEGQIYEMFIPEEWALKIISQEEWNMLLSLPNLRHVTDPERIKEMQKPLKEE